MLLSCQSHLNSVRTVCPCTGPPGQAVLDVPIYGHVSALQSFRPRVGGGAGVGLGLRAPSSELFVGPAVPPLAGLAADTAALSGPIWYQ